MFREYESLPWTSLLWKGCSNEGNIGRNRCLYASSAAAVFRHLGCAARATPHILETISEMREFDLHLADSMCMRALGIAHASLIKAL